MFKYTYGYWEIMRNELRNSQHFMLNWALHSRSVIDIQKRSDFLVKLFKKELYTGAAAVKDEVDNSEPRSAEPTTSKAKLKGKSKTSVRKMKEEVTEELASDSESKSEVEEESYEPAKKKKGGKKPAATKKPKGSTMALISIPLEKKSKTIRKAKEGSQSSSEKHKKGKK